MKKDPSNFSWIFLSNSPFFSIFFIQWEVEFSRDPIHEGNLVGKSKKCFLDLELTQTENFDFRFGVFWLTTTKQNAWLEIAASYKRKLSRASHAAHLV